MAGLENETLFETMKPGKALAKMALPTIGSQLIILIYNLADTWFIGRTNNPYMIGASSLALTVYLAAVALANVFGVGGGTLMVSYHLSSQEVWIHSESLVIYPDLNALRTGDNAVSFPFDTLISAAGFGEDPTIILSIVLKADYNILADGVQYFIPDEAQIAAMTEQID